MKAHRFDGKIAQPAEFCARAEFAHTPREPPPADPLLHAELPHQRGLVELVPEEGAAKSPVKRGWGSALADAFAVH